MRIINQKVPDSALGFRLPGRPLHEPDAADHDTMRRLPTFIHQGTSRPRLGIPRLLARQPLVGTAAFSSGNPASTLAKAGKNRFFSQLRERNVHDQRRGQRQRPRGHIHRRPLQGRVGDDRHNPGITLREANRLGGASRRFKAVAPDRWAWRRREARCATSHADSADQRSAPTSIFAKLRFFAETNAPHEIPI